VRLLALRPAGHERDLVVRAVWIRAQEDHAALPVLLGQLHAHEVLVEISHLLQVPAVNADVAEANYSRHDNPPRSVLMGMIIGRWK
jgi:hypothetical protein